MCQRNPDTSPPMASVLRGCCRIHSSCRAAERRIRSPDRVKAYERKAGDRVGFLDDLRCSNPQLAVYVDLHVADVSADLEAKFPLFAEYTDHSVAHSRRVLQITEQLVTESITDYEKALLILFAYFHDWGMVVTEKEYADHVSSLGDDENIQLLIANASVREGVVDPDLETGKLLLALKHFRDNHAKRSAQKIMDAHPTDDPCSYCGEAVYIWDTVARLCESHGRSVSEILDDPAISTTTALGAGVTVDAVFLCGVSRLADACHFSRDRALPFLRQEIRFLSRRSENIWRFYADIVDTVPDRGRGRLRVTATCGNAYIHRAIINSAKELEAELLKTHHLLSEGNSSYSLVWN